MDVDNVRSFEDSNVDSKENVRSPHVEYGAFGFHSLFHLREVSGIDIVELASLSTRSHVLYVRTEVSCTFYRRHVARPNHKVYDMPRGRGY